MNKPTNNFVEDLLSSVGLEGQSTAVFSFLIGLFFMIAAVVLFRKKRKTGNTILIIGTHNAGKTVLFQQLRDGKFVNSYTSMKENEDSFVLHSNATNAGSSKREVHVVDIPGSERLRPLMLDFLPITTGIVYVIDSVEFESEVRVVSQFIYYVLTNKIVHRNKIPIIIACNKKDLVISHDQAFVVAHLEREIEKLRHTRKSIPDQNQDEVEEVFLGIEGDAFKIAHLENDLYFTECSAKQGELQGIVDFINALVK